MLSFGSGGCRIPGEGPSNRSGKKTLWGDTQVQRNSHDADTSPIECLESLTPEQTQLLKTHWIDTLEGLVSAAVTDSGQAGLARLLDVPQERMAELLERARDMLGPDKVKQLTTGKSGGSTGALLTDEQKERFGMTEGPGGHESD